MKKIKKIIFFFFLLYVTKINGQCTSTPYSENFDISIGTFTNNGWTLDANGTPSTNTGPSDDITGGGNYMYYETTSTPPSPVNLVSECLDISSLTNPTLSFYYHMYGTTIGTLEVIINSDTLWSLSGNQGNYWHLAQVDLSNYIGVNIVITFSAIYGGSFTGDIAIDNVMVDEPLPGCTDSLACNYNFFSIIDDGSCLYPPLAPYYEDFGTGVIPSGIGCGWSQTTAIGDGWKFNGLPEFAAAYNGRDTGTYAWVDFTGIDSAVILEMEAVDMATLTTPGLFFDYYSFLDTFMSGTNPTLNILNIETWNGSSWSLLGNFQLNTPGWNTQFKYLTNTAYINNIVKIRFRAEEAQTGANHINDLLLDNIKIQEVIIGCTDSLACNYDSLANIDSGSCTDTLIGCTDPLACNYDPTALCDDTSCCYSSPSILITETACDSYTWNGITYNNSGTYINIDTNFCGCDSSVTLNLSLGYTDSVLVVDTGYNSYSWNGQIINSAGTYTNTLLNVFGCDSVVTLSLTIINTTEIIEKAENKRRLFKVVDVLGKETPTKRNRVLFYIYTDGTIEKKMKIK